MGKLRYKWLIKRGYRTVDGKEFHDNEFDERWVRITMKKGNRVKRTILFDTSLENILESENYESQES